MDFYINGFVYSLTVRSALNGFKFNYVKSSDTGMILEVGVVFANSFDEAIKSLVNI